MSKSEYNQVCLICREEEPEFLTLCNHNFHEECLINWHEKIKNECPYCRSFITLNNYEEILSYLDQSKVDERVFQYLIRNVKSESAKGRYLRSVSEKGNYDAVRLFLDQKTPLEAKDYDGYTSLIRASFEGHLKVVKLLLDHGATAGELE